jgi:hypothetical protein
VLDLVTHATIFQYENSPPASEIYIDTALPAMAGRR